MVFEIIRSEEIFSNLLTSLTVSGGSDETRTRDLRRDRPTLAITISTIYTKS